MRKYELEKRLAGAYDAEWKGTYWYACLTGHCQLASAWLRLYTIDGDPRLLNVAAKAALEVCRHQRTKGGSRNTRGAIAGSSPIYGRYMPLRYPNWTAKFFVDAMCALLAELDRLRGAGDKG